MLSQCVTEYTTFCKCVNAGGTLGRTAGIFRTGMVGQPHMLTSVVGVSQAQPTVMQPAGPVMGGGSGSIRSNSPGYASNQQLMVQQQNNSYHGSGSLGHSRHSSSSSGPPGAPRSGYATGMQLPPPTGQAQPVVMPTPQQLQVRWFFMFFFSVVYLPNWYIYV